MCCEADGEHETFVHTFSCASARGMNDSRLMPFVGEATTAAAPNAALDGDDGGSMAIETLQSSVSGGFTIRIMYNNRTE